MKIYISGPISGLPFEEALKNFSEAEKEIIKAGHEAINPCKISLDPKYYNLDWIGYMKIAIKMMMDCDAVYFISGYNGSYGSLTEKSIAIMIGMDYSDNLNDLI